MNYKKKPQKKEELFIEKTSYQKILEIGMLVFINLLSQ